MPTKSFIVPLIIHKKLMIITVNVQDLRYFRSTAVEAFKNTGFSPSFKAGKDGLSSFSTPVESLLSFLILSSMRVLRAVNFSLTSSIYNKYTILNIVICI